MSPHQIPYIIFAVSMLVFLPALYYYARKPGVHPRFRPKLGETTLVAVLGLGFCGAISLGISTMLGVSGDLDAMKSGEGFSIAKPRKEKALSKEEKARDETLLNIQESQDSE